MATQRDIPTFQRAAEGTGASPSFLLHEYGGAWLVRAGRVDLYAVKVREGTVVSRRRHLLRVTAGEALFSIAPHAGYGLLAVGTAETELARLDAAEVAAATWDAERAGRLSQHADRWVNELAAGALALIPPKEHEVLTAGEEPVVVREGACLRAAGETLWVRHLEGGSFFMGREQLPPAGPADGPLPIGRHVWLRTSSASTLAVRSTRELIRDGGLREGLAQFHACLLGGVAARVRHAERKERRRLRHKAQADRAALSGASSHLASVIDEDETLGGTQGENPLLAACRMVGSAAGLDITAPAEAEHARRPCNVSDIARSSQVRYRKVALRGRWWKQDGGPLVGLVVDDDSSEGGQSRTPVALLQTGSSGYEAHDPLTGAVLGVVDEAFDARLHPFAYSFYRPFADEAVSAWDVFKFGAERCRKDFLMILLMGIAGGLLGMVTPVITGVIFNTVIPEAERAQLGQMVAALFACAVATGLFSLVRGLTVLRVESRMEASVQSAVWDRLLKLPPSFFRRFAAGDLASRAGGISGIRRLLSGATISSMLSGLFSVFQLGLLFYYDASLALWAVGLTAAALAVTLGATYAQLRYQRVVAEKQSVLAGNVLQFITGITKLRVAGAESKAFKLWAEDFGEQRKMQVKVRRIGNGLASFNVAFPTLTLMVIFGVMIMREDAVMATGDFIAFNAALGTFTASMLSMTGAFVSVLMALPLYEQAKPILEALPETDRAKADPGPLSGEVEMQHVSFRYDPEGTLILKDVALHVKQGEFVALVGPSGSGKSTVLRLLLGFEEPEAGSIYYDGQDFEGLDVQAVRRQMGVVLQNGRLMSGDIFTNITGSSRATMDDAWEAARMAGLAEDIKAMPMGMHTVVNGGSSTLSGGQRQRLLVARAIINRPRILFFDEATSALDNRTQAIVSESLERLQATRIVVAHRLSTIVNADRICVMDRGQIVQEGTYEALMEEGGLFGALMKRQLA